jgi:hypothetical protein
MQKTDLPLQMPLKQAVLLYANGTSQTILLRDPNQEIDLGRIVATDCDFCIDRSGSAKIYLVYDIKDIRNPFWKMSSPRSVVVNPVATRILLLKQLLDVVPDDPARGFPTGPVIFFKTSRRQLQDYTYKEFVADWERFFQAVPRPTNPLGASFVLYKDRVAALELLRPLGVPRIPKYTTGLENLDFLC